MKGWVLLLTPCGKSPRQSKKGKPTGVVPTDWSGSGAQHGRELEFVLRFATRQPPQHHHFPIPYCVTCLPQRRGFENRYSLTRHCLPQRNILGQWTAAVCCFQGSLAAPHSGAETGDHRGCPIADARVRAPNCQREVSPSTCLARSCLRHDEHGSAVVVAARAPPSTAGTDRTETGHVARTGPSGA
jgi:hypothetical protein